jgi:hypothetical protein
MLWLHYLVAALAIAGAVWRVKSKGDADNTALLYLAVAALMPLLRSIRSFGFGDLKVELENVKKELKQVESASVSAAVYGVGKTKNKVSDENLTSDGKLEQADPNKGQFRGLPTRDGKQLSAKIEPIGYSDQFFNITLEVRSVDKSKPLTGNVKFFLHPTFSNPTPIVPVDKNGVARLTTVAYGAFTVGAETEDGTRLELDLTQVTGASEGFYLR